MARGRKPSLTDEQRDLIIAKLTKGLGRGTAAALAETTHQTINREIARNAEFRKQVKKAEAHCMEYHIDRVSSGGMSWQSSAWFLERKWPQKWGAVKREPPQAKEPDLPDDPPPTLA